MPDLGIFGLEFENNIVIFEINTFELGVKRFGVKIKILKFGIKNA